MDNLKVANFDDLVRIRELISNDFGSWGDPLVITQEMINQFANLTNDYQWIHVDVERARKESPFGTTIAHGLLILSLMPSINPQGDQFRFEGHRSAMVYGVSNTRFFSPVMSDSEIQARCRLANVEEHKKGSLMTFEVAIHVVGSLRPSMMAGVQLLYVGD